MESLRDLASATSGDPVVRRALAAEIRSACVDVGFFYGKGTVIALPPSYGRQSRTTVYPTMSSTRLSVPQSASSLCPSTPKQRLRPEFRLQCLLLTITQLDIHATPNFKGYTALLGEKTNPASKGDLHEGFDIGWEPVCGAEIFADGPSMYGSNVWPENLPGFREDVLAY